MPPDELGRREFMKSGAFATPAFLGLGWGPLADNEDPAEVLEYDGNIPLLPDHITEVRDDLTELENYQPRLVMQSQQARDDMEGMFGWTAESEDYDVTAHYYWVRSFTQRSFFQHYFGLDINFKDSHYKDHEPILVFQSPDGTVDKVVFSGGHHLAAEVSGEWGPLIEDRVTDRRTHAVLRQARPHNHFIPVTDADEDGEWVQGFAEFDTWLTVDEGGGEPYGRYESWYRNDRYEKTSDVAVMDPFSFYEDDGRTHWWREGTQDAWLAKNVYVRRLATPDTFRYEEV